MPRVPPVPAEQWDDRTRRALTAHLRRPELYLGDDPRPMPNVLGLLAHHPALGEAWLSFNAGLAAGSTLGLRLRELIVLRIAWRAQCAYEWSQHARIGQEAGLTAEQVRAVRDDPAGHGWSPAERAVLAAADDVVEHHRASEATCAELRQHFDEAALLDVLFVAGAYLCFAVVVNSTGLEPDTVLDPVEVPPLPPLPGPTGLPGDGRPTPHPDDRPALREDGRPAPHPGRPTVREETS